MGKGVPSSTKAVHQPSHCHDTVQLAAHQPHFVLDRLKRCLDLGSLHLELLDGERVGVHIGEPGEMGVVVPGGHMVGCVRDGRALMHSAFVTVEPLEDVVELNRGGAGRVVLWVEGNDVVEISQGELVIHLANLAFHLSRQAGFLAAVSMGKVDEGTGADVEGVSLDVAPLNQSLDPIELGATKDGAGGRFLHRTTKVEMLAVLAEMVFGGLADLLKGTEHVECRGEGSC